MRFFRNRAVTGAASQAPVLQLGSGRRLRSDLPLDSCLALLDALLNSYRPPESPYRTAYVTPGWRWIGAQQQVPQIVVACNDSNLDFLLAIFWPAQSGTEYGLIPLGSGDQRLSAMPIIGHWKQRDPSLSSIGVVPSGQICLEPPQVPEQFVEEILQTAGFSATPHNVDAIGSMMSRMFVGKAHQFIASKDARNADRFVQSHTYTGGPFTLFYQAVLNDIGAWYPDFLPFIQDLPMRIRAVALESATSPGTVWESLSR